MAKFDPSKPHGTVHGCLEGRKFEQEGKYFNGVGEEVLPKGQKAPKVADAPVVPAAPATAVPAAVASQVAKQG